MSNITHRDHDPHHERLTTASRLRAVEGTHLVGSSPEERYDRITRLAVSLTGAPMSLVSIVDAQGQYLKSHAGVAEELREGRSMPLSHSLCQYVAALGTPVVIDDARLDPTYADNCSVTELGVVAYAGVPLDVDGETIGSLCVLSNEPRAWADQEIATLQDLASFVVDQIALERAASAAERRRSQVRDRALALHARLAQHVSAGQLAARIGAWESVQASLDAAAAGLQATFEEVAQSLADGDGAPGLAEVTDGPGSARGWAPARSTSSSDGERREGSSLSPREVEVLELVCQGLPNRDIAARLGISVDTTKKHVSNILRKLELPSRAALIAATHRRAG